MIVAYCMYISYYHSCLPYVASAYYLISIFLKICHDKECFLIDSIQLIFIMIQSLSRVTVTKHIFVQLQEKVVRFLHRSAIRSHSILPIIQLAIALQFLATDSFQTAVSTSHCLFQPSVSRCSDLK